MHCEIINHTKPHEKDQRKNKMLFRKDSSMKNVYILTAVGLSALAGYVVMKKVQKNNEKDHTLLEDAGIPDQVNHQDQEQLSKADMVSEGSLYGVQYYNEATENEPSEVTS